MLALILQHTSATTVLVSQFQSTRRYILADVHVYGPRSQPQQQDVHPSDHWLVVLGIAVLTLTAQEYADSKMKRKILC